MPGLIGLRGLSAERRRGGSLRMPTKPKPYEHSRAKRRNIPTDRDQVYVDELRERTPFSPEPAGTEGPRLSWRRSPGIQRIETDAMPLYIHEKVSPAAFVEQISKDTAAPGQGTFFDDFNGFPSDARYDWYRHEGNWQNRIIRGNSVEVMASLAKKEGMAGQVQIIYFDPPYGIGFKSNYQSSTRKRKRNSAPVESTSRRAFRDTYVDGVHSYMDTVFRIAVHGRALLRDSGSFFLQIGTENVHRLAVVLDEVFGPENRVATIAFAKSGDSSANQLPQVSDYLVWYARDKGKVKYHQLYDPLDRKEKIEHMSSYATVELADGTTRALTAEERLDPDRQLPPKARLFKREQIQSQGEGKQGRSDPYLWDGSSHPCRLGYHWQVSNPEGLDRLAARDRLAAAGKGRLSWKRYEDEIPGRKVNNLWREQHSASDLHYVVETAEKTIERCLLMATDPGDLVLDPTCGSGTTALVAERWGRRWITIDASAIPVALCRQRILSSVHRWFLTQDDPDGRKEEAKLSGRLDDYVSDADLPVSAGLNDPSSGFVYERVPYVSAAHLAYDRPPKATLLVNRPVAKRGVKRIASPFTVESHSPWLYVSPSREAVAGDERAERETTDNERETAIRENVVHALAVTGIEAPDLGRGPAGERWRFDGIELSEDAAPAVFLTHEATLRVVADNDQAQSGPSSGAPAATGERVAIATVPDDQTATAQLIDDAAFVAARRGFGKLLVVAFHFDAQARNEERGKLQVVLVRANRDLTIRDLKSVQEDTAFVLVGEPDVETVRRDDGMWQVRVRGYQVYDPGTGNVRPAGKTGDIDCWMLDTDYDGRSFFARRIHFPGKSSDKQIKALKRELGARVDPEQWEFMESLTSAPFGHPGSRRIAVRIVTTFGDEMLAVVELPFEASLPPSDRVSEGQS